jgi:hypothetical protein
VPASTPAEAPDTSNRPRPLLMRRALLHTRSLLASPRSVPAHGHVLASGDEDALLLAGIGLSSSRCRLPKIDSQLSLALRLRSGGLPSPHDPGENDEEEDGESDPEHNSRRVAARQSSSSLGCMTALRRGFPPGPGVRTPAGLPRGEKVDLDFARAGRACASTPFRLKAWPDVGYTAAPHSLVATLA